jgi:hypothetical protein
MNPQSIPSNYVSISKPPILTPGSPQEAAQQAMFQRLYATMMGQAPTAEVDIIYQQIQAQYYPGNGHPNSVQSPPATAENVLLAANPKLEP